ncbi:MAG: hypothetical protein GH151_04980 [Bacteroidetes bacterium]|nr:hypothetical protein [Bacteroidota bacterium]
MTKKPKKQFSSKKVLFVILVFLVVGHAVAAGNAVDTTGKQKFMNGEFGRDLEYGGWFGSISQTGEPKETDKGASSQLYSNVGLTQYYFVTGDECTLSHVMKSVEIHKTYAHDEEFDGYYMKLNRDLSVSDSSKAKHSHYGQGSLMPNLILATQDSAVISFSKHLADLCIERMIDPVNGWILGYPNGFDREWNYVPYLVDSDLRRLFATSALPCYPRRTIPGKLPKDRDLL